MPQVKCNLSANFESETGSFVKKLTFLIGIGPPIMDPYIIHIKFQKFTNSFWQFLFLSHIADMPYSIDLFIFFGKTVKK
jgi:hypothetical protein